MHYSTEMSKAVGSGLVLCILASSVKALTEPEPIFILWQGKVEMLSLIIVMKF